MCVFILPSTVNAGGSVTVSPTECEGQVTGRYYCEMLGGRQLTRGQTATGDADFGSAQHELKNADGKLATKK